MGDVRYGREKPKGYLHRIVDERVARLLELFGAVEIRGTKWCGKTWSALAFGESVVRIDDANVKTLVAADPSVALVGAAPRVLDEWQEVPALWDAVRRSVDVSQAKGAYILTGSSMPDKEQVLHSGAGRIARIDMSTMTLWERGESEGSVSLSGLFEGDFSPAPADGGLARAADAVCCGGWPALTGATPEDALEVIGHYVDALLEVSVPRKGGDPRVARKIAQSLARNVATAATIGTLAADAAESDAEGRLAASTVTRYLRMFEDVFLIEELPGWDAPIRSRSRLRTKPKRYFADPSIPAAMLGCSPGRLLQDAQMFGLLFESLCVHDVRAYASVVPGCHRDSIRYYQDADGLEVDIVIELQDGRWAGIEVKLGEDKVPAGIKSLRRLRSKIAANPAARNPEPAFLAVVTAVGTIARRDPESGVYVFPLTVLRP